MRKSETNFLISFPTTSAAMAMESACRRAGIPGRLIPVPGFIRAGCGMCWISPEDKEEALKALISSEGLETESMQTVTL